jgi:hypothetical protein
MRNTPSRLAASIRLAVTSLALLLIATPASAQFGGLKKKAKATATQEAVKQTADAVPGDQGGMIVLTDDVVKQLLKGLKAGQAERDAAAKEDTPFGRYRTAKAAYAVAQPKCEKAQQAFYMRAESNKKLFNKWTAYNDKVTAAQEKGDLKLALVYQDSALALQDPSCIVKDPEAVPPGYYEAQRDLDIRVEKLEVKASGFTSGDLATVKERTTAILEGATPPGGASKMEKSAVSAKSAELKPLLGVKDQPPAQAAKPAPAPAPTPTPTAPAVDPQMSAATSNMSACMIKNTEKNEAKLEALGKRAEAAEAAGDTQKLMAIADTMQRLQMAGCH